MRARSISATSGEAAGRPDGGGAGMPQVYADLARPGLFRPGGANGTVRAAPARRDGPPRPAGPGGEDSRRPSRGTSHAVPGDAETAWWGPVTARLGKVITVRGHEIDSRRFP
ncbi:hypothetical protein Shyhy01_59340 [Streptomyces hygroscopicus subsp. hygroscopicus]|nr:hypothetical protein Shyhy01_59340 [Streptomyces hygroscopicus subsp. hygroscopicus]